MTPWVLRLIVANVIVFFIQMTVQGFTRVLEFIPVYVLIHPWTVVTYMFAHAGVEHILFNMLALYFFGPQVEARMGAKRFLTLYFLSGISGAVASFFFAPTSPIIGASAAVFGVMLAFARFWPDAQILLFFFFPIQARLAVLLMAAFSLWSGLNGSMSGVADFAHLGGFAGAWFYLLWLERRAGTTRFRKQAAATTTKDTVVKLTNWKKVDPRSVHEVNRDEVNRILDKINKSGLTSLTPQERLFLSNFVPPDDRVPPPT